MMGISSSRSISSASSSLLLVFFAMAVVSSQNLCSSKKPWKVVGCCVNTYRNNSKTGFVIVWNASRSGLDASVVLRLLLLFPVVETMSAAVVVIVILGLLHIRLVHCGAAAARESVVDGRPTTSLSDNGAPDPDDGGSTSEDVSALVEV